MQFFYLMVYNKTLDVRETISVDALHKIYLWQVTNILGKSFLNSTEGTFAECEAIKENELCQGLNHDIVYQNKPILRRRVCLETTNNIAKVKFHFLVENSFSIFQVSKMVFLCEVATKVIFRKHNTPLFE
jgi:hypothetical protein